MIIHTTSFKRRMFRLIGVGLTFFILSMAAVAVYALKPSKVPDDVIAQGEGVVTIHKGKCTRKTGDTLCMVGLHQEKRYLLMLLYEESGVHVEVIRLEEDGKEVSLWRHPGTGV